MPGAIDISKGPIHVEVDTIALRDAYPVRKRKWGMRITVIGGLTYYLLRGLSSTNKSDNLNWVSEALYMAAIGVGSGTGSSTDKQLLFNNVNTVAGFGQWSGSKLSLPAINNDGGGLSFELKQDLANRLVGEGMCWQLDPWNSPATIKVFLTSTNIPNGVTLFAETWWQGTQSSGTKAATGFGYKVRAMFRKSGGVLTQIGASAVEYSYNDTGDAITAPTLSTDGNDVRFNTGITTAKSFSVMAWLKVTMNE